MQLISIDEKIDIQDPVVTIGIFDGVHRGHKYILEKLIARAREVNGHSVVVTLWPHPRIVLNKDVWNFKLLHSQEEKISHFEKLGIDYLMIIPFSRELASLDACDFVQEYLIEKLNVKRLLLGYDNRFGKDRKGDPDGLSDCSSKYGFIIEKMDEFRSAEENVSSTSIRNALLAGEIENSREMLDYDYYLAGTVIQGKQLGRKLGYPTANVNPHSAYKLIPKDGVYAARAEVKGRIYEAMVNIGVRPTLDSANPVKVIEAHLLEFKGDIYDKDIVIHFCKRIRDEQRFDGLDALKDQLNADEKEIRSYFK